MSLSHKSLGPVLQDVRKLDSDYFACGGLADLYRGQWTRRSGEIVQVAIKFIRGCNWGDKAAMERARKRFLLESHLWSQLRHPNIVPFYGLIFERDSPGLVMPYYKNGDLLLFLQKNPQFNKLNLICEVAAGLEYLHHLRPHTVIHGDIKASNVLITNNHQACLTDFGVAKMLSVTGYTTTSVGGTCRWMAPELLEDHEPSPTIVSDIWAFGMTVLQILTGRTPFDYLRADVTVILSLMRNSLPPQPPEIDHSMWTLLRRCWVFEPSKRPAISTISMILDIMTSQTLAPDHVTDLVDYLEVERHRLGDSRSERSSVEDVTDPIAAPPEKSKKRLFSVHLPKFPLGRSVPSHSGSSPKRFSLPTLRRYSLAEKIPEPPTVVTADPYATFHCHWPECGGYFTTLLSRRAHEIQHWLSWQHQSQDDMQNGANTMPTISSVAGL